MPDQIDHTRPSAPGSEPSRYDLCIHCGHTSEPHLSPEYARIKHEPVCEQCGWLGNRLTEGRECPGYERATSDHYRQADNTDFQPHGLGNEGMNDMGGNAHATETTTTSATEPVETSEPQQPETPDTAEAETPEE